MQKTITFLMFTGEQCGKAEKAINFYISLFENSEIKSIEYFKADEPGGNERCVKHALFTLGGLEYMAIDSPAEHAFTFTPAVSVYVNCETENEINKLYESLSHEGSAMMPLGDYGFSKKFGWISDKYGVSWQLNFTA
jgi:predicted 3-demethylubiquinone-9 3-methyltransferase (glyoxalase superfamily)